MELHPIFLLPFIAAFVGRRYFRLAITWLAILLSMMAALGYLCLLHNAPFRDTAINTVVVTAWGFVAPGILRQIWRIFRRRMRNTKFFLGFLMTMTVIIYVTVPQAKPHLEPIIGSIMALGVIYVAYRWMFSGLRRKR